MNLMDTIDEIGIFETNTQLVKYATNSELMNDIAQYIPIVSNLSMIKNVDCVIKRILNLQKRNIMFLSNEILILEKLLNYNSCFDNIIVVLSNNLKKSQKENIIKNSPSKFISYINELDYPTIIKPKDSVIISFGYKDNKKCLLTKNNYRTLEVYKDFLGEMVFVNCFENDVKERVKNWVSINEDKYFTREI